MWFSSVQFSRSVVSDSLWPHKSQHARPPCPSPTPGVHSDSRPSSQWCHPGFSSSVVPFSSCPQSLPASESFPMSQLFTWGGQSTGVSASASCPPKKSQGWSPSEWTGWIYLQSMGLSRVFSKYVVSNYKIINIKVKNKRWKVRIIYVELTCSKVLSLIGRHKHDHCNRLSRIPVLKYSINLIPSIPLVACYKFCYIECCLSLTSV